MGSCHYLNLRVSVCSQRAWPQELPGFQVVLGVLSLLSFAAVFEDYALSGSTAWFTCSARSPDLTAIASRLHASETL